MAAIFISHSSLDNALAGQLKDWLAAEGYERVFLDFDKHTGLAAGEGWEARLYTELARCHAVILVVTPNWLESKWCFAEYTQARALGKTIFPVILSAVGSVSVAADVQAIDLRDWDSEGRAHLGRRLRLLTGEVARGFSWDHARPPFPGMHAFDRGDAAVFFGRDPEIREVIERLEARRSHGGGPLLLVLGGSGSGKSSLMRAGVLETLARRESTWIVLPTIRPQAAAVEALAKSMAEAIGRPADWRHWYDRLMRVDAADALRDFARDLRVGARAHANVLLAIDQFEELYTVEAGAMERPAFLRVLAAIAAAGGVLPWQAIATARSDLLDQMLAHDNGGRLAVETYALRPMPMSRLSSLIEGPATVGAVALERGFVERVQRDATTPEALPLLAVALRELYDRHGGQRRFTIAQYEALGDAEHGLGPLANAIRQKADRALAAAQATGVELAALRGALIPALVRVDDSGAFLRQPARRSLMPAAAGRLVDVLTTARLLVAGGEDDADRIEVAHEALFAAWPLLRGWLEEERAFLQALARLDRAATLWEERGRSPDYLLPGGAQLTEAEDIALRRSAALVGRPGMASFIAASSAAEGQRQEARLREGRARLRRRLWYAASAVAALVILFIGGMFVAWQAFERRSAQDMADASHLIAVIENMRRTMPEDRAGHISRILEALRRDEERAADILRLSPHSQATLIEAILTNYEIERPPITLLAIRDDMDDPNSGVQHVVSSADGKRQIAATEKSAWLFATDVGVLPKAIPLVKDGRKLEAVHMSADGRLAVIVADGKVELWDLSTIPGTRREANAPGDGVTSTVLSDDGRWLAAATSFGVHLLDIAQGRWRSLPDTPKANLWAIAVRSDDHVIVAGIDKDIGFVLDGKTGTRTDLGRGTIAVSLARQRPIAVTVSKDNQVETWQYEADPPVQRKLIGPGTLDRSGNEITLAVLDGEGGHLVTLDAAQRLVLWDIRETTDYTPWLTLQSDTRLVARAGEHLLSVGYDDVVRIWSLSSERFREQVIGPTSSAVIGPAGEVLLARDGDGGTTIRVLASQAPLSTIADAREHKPLAVSRDGRTVLTADGDGHLLLWRRSDQRWTKHETALTWGGEAQEVLLSDDGSVVAARSSDDMFDILEIGPDGAVNSSKPLMTGRTNAFALSGDGKILAASVDERFIYIWTLADRQSRPVKLPGEMRSIAALSLDRDGTHLAIADQRGNISLVTLRGASVPEPRLLRTAPMDQITLSTDGSAIIARTRLTSALEVYDLTAAEPVRIDLGWVARNALSVSFDRDASYVVSINRQGEIYRLPVLVDAAVAIELARRVPK